MTQKILIMGCTGSGKSTLAAPFSKLINGVLIESDQLNVEYATDTTAPANRLRFIADGVVRAGKIAVIVHDCATNQDRIIIDPDYVVWMDTVPRNSEFESPAKVDYHVSAWFDDTHQQLFEVVMHYLNKQAITES